MDGDALVAAARGDSVTAERLSAEVVRALDDGEQPHHLLFGSSLDHETGSTRERVYAAVDETATAAATGDRLLFVVPESLGVDTTSVPYDHVDDVEAGFGPRELRVTAGAAEYRFNVAEGERHEAVAEFVEERAAAAAGGGTATDADRSVTSDGGRSAGGRVEDASEGASESGRTDGSASASASPFPSADDGDGDDGGGRQGAGVDVGVGVGVGSGSGAVDGVDDDDAGDATGVDVAADPGADADAGGSGPTPDADPLDTLERLAELNERGVIDDDEFEAKKAELLDQI